MKYSDCTIYVSDTKSLICAFVFAYAKSRFSRDADHIPTTNNFAVNTLNCKSEPRREKTRFLHMRSKDADQLCGNREADQRFCFRYKDRTILLLPKSEMLGL